MEGSSLENTRPELEQLTQTEGFASLTEKQKRLITASLYIQSRADRGESETAAGKYEISRDHIRRWYCHAAVHDLEREAGSDVEPKLSLLDTFFAENHQEVKDFAELKKIVERQGFPCVIQVGVRRNQSQHSLLALGHNPEGDVLIWDKEGRGLPYRVVSLQAVYADYPTSHYAVRKLHQPATP